jgi:hypothetical protein
MKNTHPFSYTNKSPNGNLLTCVADATRSLEISARSSQGRYDSRGNVGMGDPYVVIVKLSEATYTGLFLCERC